MNRREFSKAIGVFFASLLWPKPIWGIDQAYPESGWLIFDKPLSKHDVWLAKTRHIQSMTFSWQKTVFVVEKSAWVQSIENLDWEL